MSRRLNWERLLRLLDEGDREAARHVMSEAARRGDDDAWERAARLLMRTPLLSHADTRSIAFSSAFSRPLVMSFDATGRFLTVGSGSSRQLLVFDAEALETGRERPRIIELPSTLRALRAHPFQQAIYVTCARRGVWRVLLSLGTLEPVDVRQPVDLAFRPDGDLILITEHGLERVLEDEPSSEHPAVEEPSAEEGEVYEDDVVIRISELGIPAPHRPQPLPLGVGPESVALFGAGRWLVERAGEGALRSWSVEHLETEPRCFPRQEVEGRVELLDGTPDGAWMLVRYEAGTRTELAVIATEDGAIAGETGVEGFVLSAALSPDGAWVSALTHEGELLFWSRDGLDEAPRCVLHENAQGAEVLFDPWCGVLLLCDLEAIHLLAVPWVLRQARRMSLDLGEEPILVPPCFAFSGWRLLTASENAVTWHELAEGRHRELASGPPLRRIYALAQDGDGTRVAWSEERELVWGDGVSGTLSRVELESRCVCLAWSPRGTTIALGVGSEDTWWYELRSAETGERVGRFETLSGSPCLCVFSPCGRYVLGVDVSGALQMWRRPLTEIEVSSRVCEGELGLQSGGAMIAAVGFDAEGAWLLTVSGVMHRAVPGGSVERGVWSLPCPEGTTGSGAFSPGGRYLAWCSGGTLAVYAVEERRVVWSRRQEEALPWLFFHSDGTLAVLQTFFHQTLVLEPVPGCHDPGPARLRPRVQGSGWWDGRDVERRPERMTSSSAGWWRWLSEVGEPLDAVDHEVLVSVSRMLAADAAVRRGGEERRGDVRALCELQPVPARSPHRALDQLRGSDVVYSERERERIARMLGEERAAVVLGRAAGVERVWRFEQHYRRLEHELGRELEAAEGVERLRRATDSEREALILLLPRRLREGAADALKEDFATVVDEPRVREALALVLAAMGESVAETDLWEGLWTRLRACAASLKLSPIGTI